MDNINQRVYANLLFLKIDTKCELCCTIVLYSRITLESKVTRAMNVCVMLITVIRFFSDVEGMEQNLHQVDGIHGKYARFFADTGRPVTRNDKVCFE